MERIITAENLTRHRIEKYRFKTLEAHESKEEGKEGVQPYCFPEFEVEKEVEERDDSTESSATEEKGEEDGAEANPLPDSAFEEMLKKIDELSGELVKTQMQLEKANEVCEGRMKEAKEEGYSEGLEAGKEECDARLETELGEIRKRLKISLEALEQSRKTFLQKIDTVEEDLIETALDLAREVIVKEISKESREIALRLAHLLLTEVKEAAKVTLRVNPEDYDYLKEGLKDRENLDIVSDPAVGPGGVVIVSDLGEIDGQIMHRFERIKEAVFGTAR